MNATQELMIQLIPRHQIEQHENLIQHLIDAGVPGLIAFAKDNFYGSAFRYYLFFAADSALEDTPFCNLTALEIFYNKYYWFLLFTKLCQLRDGYDGGLEQQAFKLLETAPSNIDWVLLEEIEKRVESEIANS